MDLDALAARLMRNTGGLTRPEAEYLVALARRTTTAEAAMERYDDALARAVAAERTVAAYREALRWIGLNATNPSVPKWKLGEHADAVLAQPEGEGT